MKSPKLLHESDALPLRGSIDLVSWLWPTKANRLSIAEREVQDTGRLLGSESAAQDVVEDIEAVLRSGVQGDRLPAVEGDKVTGRLAGDRFTGRPRRAKRPVEY